MCCNWYVMQLEYAFMIVMVLILCHIELNSVYVIFSWLLYCWITWFELSFNDGKVANGLCLFMEYDADANMTCNWMYK